MSPLFALQCSVPRPRKSRRHCSKHLADRFEEVDIALGSTLGDLIEPAHRRWFETCLGGITGWVDQLNLHFDGIPAAAHPKLAILSPYFHSIHSTRKTVTHLASYMAL